MAMSDDLNIGAITLFICYMLLGFYLMLIVLQRIQYTLKSPLPLTLVRCMLFFIILIWNLFTNLLHLYSCIIAPETAKTSKYFKYAFYIEFYFYNIVWSLSVIFLAFSLKFKRDAPDKMNADNNITSDLDPAQLHANGVELDIKPNSKHADFEQTEEEKYADTVYQGTKDKAVCTFAKPKTVYDNNKRHQNIHFFFMALYVFGIGSLTFTVLWYAVHVEQCNNLFYYKRDWLMSRWQFPYSHYQNGIVTIVTRAFLSVVLILQAVYLSKEFYNNKVAPVIITVLIIYWLLYGLCDSDEQSLCLFVYPCIYYIIFLCLHIADADRDEQPTSQSVIVNTDTLEMFYSWWPAKPYKTCIAPNIFCFGPSPRILNPKKSSIILLGGWSNMKEDYDHLAHVLSQYGRNVIVIDYRGIGETGVGPQTNHEFYTGEQYANDIMDVVKKLFADKKLDTDAECDKINSSTSTNSGSEAELNEFNAHRVYIVGLSMGGNVALQCALHADAKRYIRGVAVCSAHGGSYLLQKGADFEFYGKQILTGNALHYGWCAAQKLYIQYSHSNTYSTSMLNRCALRSFYSWRLSVHPYYCCNFSKNIKNIRDQKQVAEQRKKKSEKSGVSMGRGLSSWFNNLSLFSVQNKHSIVEGIERQIDIAQEGFNIATVIHNISIPTLVCYGKQDTIINYKTAQLLKKGIGANAWNEEFEFGGHNFWFENTNDFVTRIQDWMVTEEDYDQGNDERV